MKIEIKTLVMYGWSFAVGALVTLSIQWQDKPKVEVVCVPPPVAAAVDLATPATQLAADPSPATEVNHD